MTVEKVLMLLYEMGIRLLVLGIRVAAFFNAKARKWVEGRQNWRHRINPSPEGSGDAAHTVEYSTSPFPSGEGSGVGSKTLWLHAASLGEFEQGRPVVEAFREQFPAWRIVLTFFSPSGYEIRKDYPHADLVCYLPADTRRNARDFLDLIKPDAVIFVKYEFWANYLFELKNRNIPALLVSALFRKKQPFFQWYGGFWRKMLRCFTHFFVQNEASANLLRGIGLQNITVAGDTRVDRVLKIAEGAGENAIVATFASTPPPPPPPNGRGDIEDTATMSHLPSHSGVGLKNVFVAGSSWTADEAVFLRVFQKSELQNWKLIIAPHEPSETNVERICGQVENAVRYSQFSRSTRNDSQVLIIDNVGLLNTLYRYGKIAYIGGGFGKGIHNTLEPAAFSLPIIFGPKYEKFEEARQFVARGGAFSVRSSEELAAVLTKLGDPVFYEKASLAVRGYLEENKGATERILAFLKQNLKENP